jgi:hypothetical protein
MASDYDDEHDEPSYRPRRSRLKSSGLGIASLVIAILVGIGELIVLAIIGIMEMRTPEGLDAESIEATILGLVMIGGLGGSILGAVLAIVGLIQAGRSKIFPAIGLGLNAFLILGVIGVLVLGLLMG